MVAGLGAGTERRLGHSRALEPHSLGGGQVLAAASSLLRRPCKGWHGRLWSGLRWFPEGVMAASRLISEQELVGEAEEGEVFQASHEQRGAAGALRIAVLPDVKCPRGGPPRCLHKKLNDHVSFTCQVEQTMIRRRTAR